MVKLIADLPLAGLDETRGGVRLRAEDPGPIHALMPLGDGAALSAAMQTAHGLPFPQCGQAVSGAGGAQAISTAPDQAFLIGVAPDPGLAGLAAITDQSDAWACLHLSGEGAADVLTRLVSVDLRDTAFGEGRTARCLLGHMNCSLTRLPDRAGWRILVFRSMAAHAAEELSHAMKGVAARKAAQ